MSIPPPVPVPFEDFRTHVESLYLLRAPNTRKKMASTMRLLSRYCKSTAELNTATAARIAADLGEGRSPNTVIGYLGYIRAAVGSARDEGWLAREPNWKRVTPSPTPPEKNPPLTLEETARLLEWLAARASSWHGRRLYALTGLVALTGLRIGEAVGLRAEDVDPAGGVVKIVWRHGKGRLKTARSADTVPLPGQARGVLRGWLPRVSGCPWVFPGADRVGPWTGGSPGRRSRDELQRAARAAGLGHVTWHGLRHTFATIAATRWGVPVWAVQRILRHGSIRTTERYLHLDDAPQLVRLVADANYPHALPSD